MTQTPAEIHPSPIPAVNVAAVPQRSPLRYPGGKTWLIPHIRAWLGNAPRPRLLIEPFAGGGGVSLAAVMENLVDECLMVELDPDVAAFWRAALHHGPALIERVTGFAPTREQVEQLACEELRSDLDRGFRTLVLNRTRRGGVLANGAALTRTGENGAGVASRWYPETLKRRLLAIGIYAHRITFREADGLEVIATLQEHTTHDVALFIDPPYTAKGGKRAGARLYAHNEIDHVRLFALLAESNVNFLMTYDRSEEVEELIEHYGFHAVEVLMKNGHHNILPELIITREAAFTGGFLGG